MFDGAKTEIGPSLAGMEMDMRRPTLTQNLRAKKERLEKELAETNQAIEVLEKYPDVQQVLDVIARIGRL